MESRDPDQRLRRRRGRPRIHPIDEPIPAAPPEIPPLRDTLVDTADISFDAVLARRVLDECYFPGQPFRQGDPIVLAYRAEMAAGEWRDRRQISFGRMPDGLLVLADGYKRLWALQDRPDVVIIFNIVIIEVANERELRELWASFSMAAPRTLSQILNSSGKTEEFGLNHKLAEHLLQSTPYLAADFGNPLYAAAQLHFSLPARERFLEETLLWPLLRRYQEAIAPAEGKLRSSLMASGFLSPALKAGRDCPEEMLRFVSAVAAHDNLSRADPAFQLYSYMIDSERQKNDAKRVKQKLRLVQTQVWAQTWNSFMTGKQLRVIRVHRTPAIRLFGVD